MYVYVKHGNKSHELSNTLLLMSKLYSSMLAGLPSLHINIVTKYIYEWKTHTARLLDTWSRQVTIFNQNYMVHVCVLLYLVFRGNCFLLCIICLTVIIIIIDSLCLNCFDCVTKMSVPV